MENNKVVTIVNIQGIFYINGKRLGHDILSDLEILTLNEFLKEHKEDEKSK
jgi:hypothetical protein